METVATRWQMVPTSVLAAEGIYPTLLEENKERNLNIPTRSNMVKTSDVEISEIVGKLLAMDAQSRKLIRELIDRLSNWAVRYVGVKGQKLAFSHDPDKLVQCGCACRCRLLKRLHFRKFHDENLSVRLNNFEQELFHFVHFHRLITENAQICKTQIWAKFIIDKFSILK